MNAFAGRIEADRRAAGTVARGTEPPVPPPHDYPQIAEMQRDVDRISGVLTMLGHECEASHLFAALTLHTSHGFGIKDILGAIPVGRSANRIRSVRASMANLGFITFTVPKEKALRRPDRGPVLVVGKTRQFVLLPSRSGWVRCPARGPLTPFTETHLADDDYAFWVFDFESDRSPISDVARSHTGFSWIRALIARFPKLDMSLLASTGMLALAGILVPLLITAVFGQVIGLSSLSALPWLAVAFALILVAEAVLLTKRAELTIYVANRLEYLISTASFQRVLMLSPFVTERASPTNQASRLRSFENIRDFLSGPAFATLMDAPVALLCVVVVGVLAPSVTFVPIAAMLLFCAIFIIAWRSIRVLTSMAADEATEMQRLAIETLDKLEWIRDCGLQDIWASRLHRAVGRDQRAQFRLRLTGLLAEAAASFVYVAAIICILAAGAYAVWRGETSNITLLAITILSIRALLPFQSLCMSVQRFEQIRRSFLQINTLMDMPLETQGERNANTMHAVDGRISFVNVGFRAADTRPVLVGLDLEIEAGDVIGVYGANGTGKTSLFKMLLGMVEVSIGTIRIDGVDIRQLPLIELRRRISYVPQRPCLFPGTLRENLLHANPLASRDQVARVLEMTGLTALVAAHPAGLDRRVAGDQSRKYSLEFRYRFALARALLSNSHLLLIDELPNALMDGDLGRLVKRLLHEFKGHRTVIFVSHRTDFLSEAQRIIALRYGRVPRVETADKLLEKVL